MFRLLAHAKGHAKPKSLAAVDTDSSTWPGVFRCSDEGRGSLQSWKHPKDHPSVMEGGDAAYETQALAADYEVSLCSSHMNRSPSESRRRVPM